GIGDPGRRTKHCLQFLVHSTPPLLPTQTLGWTSATAATSDSRIDQFGSSAESPFVHPGERMKLYRAAPASPLRCASMASRAHRVGNVRLLNASPQAVLGQGDT